MRSLSLRARLLLAVAAVVVVNVVAALVVISVTSDQLLDQIDERLEAAAEDIPRPAGAADEITPIGDVYYGLVSSDGAVTTINAVRNRGELLSPPVVTTTTAAAALEDPVTVDAVMRSLEYRLVAVDVADGTLILGSPLDGYEFAVNRLTGWVVASAAAAILVLAAVAWWLLRHGIQPIKRMTAAAEVIAAGDLSERIEGADPGTEAGQLGLALNTMMGRIETSFEERAAAEARLRQFIADASHELRTPVATIRGYADLYQAGGLEDRAELDDAMRRTGQESERMSRLVIDMLNLAKLDRAPLLHTTSVDLCLLANDAVADTTAARGDRRIDTDLPSDPVLTEGDDDLLRQVFSNLLQNALDHSGPAAPVRVSVRSSGDRALVRVEDQGRGMTADEVARATQRFYRADPARSRDRGGAGLGLAIVDSVVAAHHGSLLIESEPAVGTTVQVDLPLVPDDSQRTHS